MSKQNYINEQTKFLFIEDNTNNFGPCFITLGEWYYSNDKNDLLNCVKEIINNVFNNEMLDKDNTLIKELDNNNDLSNILKEMTSLFNELSIEISITYFDNYLDALELVKLHNSRIYSDDLVKTFNEDVMC